MPLFGKKKEKPRTLDSYHYPEPAPTYYRWEKYPAFGTSDPEANAEHYLVHCYLDHPIPGGDGCVECRKSSGTCVGKQDCDVSCSCKASGGCASRYDCC